LANRLVQESDDTIVREFLKTKDFDDNMIDQSLRKSVMEA